MFSVRAMRRLVALKPAMPTTAALSATAAAARATQRPAWRVMAVATATAAATATAVGLATFGYDSAVHCAGSDANVYSFGYGAFGQLGQGDDKDRTLPELIQDLAGKGAKVVNCMGSSNASAVLTASGDLYTFGQGRDGRLGHGVSFEGSNETIPRHVEALAGRVSDVSLGEMHGVCICKDGSVYSWGKPRRMLLGHSNAIKGMPNKVEGLDGVRPSIVACGRQHTALVTEDGEVYTWGAGRDGALGHGGRQDVTRPKRVEGLAGKRVVAVACGRDHTITLTEEGEVYTFGSDNYGQIGVGHGDRYVRNPTLVRALTKHKVVAVAAGEEHSVAVVDDGSVFTWGMGQDGQLGHGDHANLTVPKAIESLAGVSIRKAAAGGGHTVAITDDSQLYAWGRGRNGQLGRGDVLESVAAARPEPRRVEFFNDKKVVSVAAGANHTVAVAQD